MEKDIAYLDLGTISYGECWDLQRDLFNALVGSKTKPDGHRDAEGGGAEASQRPERQPDESGGQEKARQYLLLCEHPPVYTLGKSGDEGNMLVTGEFLQSRGASLYRIERGGDVTFHGPGQLVGYPILDLEIEGMGLREYIYSLEQSIIDTVAEYGISGTRVAGAAGVWLTDKNRLRKICAIGVKSTRYVTMHGFALNANTDLSWFDLINPCGFTDRGVTSIEKETGTPVDMDILKGIYVEKFMKNFDIKINTEDYANRKTLGNQATRRRAQSG